MIWSDLPSLSIALILGFVTRKQNLFKLHWKMFRRSSGCLHKYVTRSTQYPAAPGHFPQNRFPQKTLHPKTFPQKDISPKKTFLPKATSCKRHFTQRHFPQRTFPPKRTFPAKDTSPKRHFTQRHFPQKGYNLKSRSPSVTSHRRSIIGVCD